jgi:hypothetical protein
VGELLHLGIAIILAVTFLVMLAMGWRGGLVVFSVPLTFALIIQLLYAGLYIEPNHTICPGICGDRR